MGAVCDAGSAGDPASGGAVGMGGGEPVSPVSGMPVSMSVSPVSSLSNPVSGKGTVSAVSSGSGFPAPMMHPAVLRAKNKGNILMNGCVLSLIIDL